MAITTSTGVPTEFRAGDTVSWTAAHADHPASTWSLIYYFRREGFSPVSVSASASGDSFAVSLTPAKSAELAAGKWEWFARVESQATGATVADKGTVRVLADPSAEHRPSFAEEALVMVEASLRGDMPTAQESVSVAGVDITKMAISERFRLRDTLKAEIARERQQRRLQKGGNRHGLQVRFI